MPGDSFRLIDGSPAVEPQAPGQVDIFLIGKKILVKILVQNLNIFQRFSPVKHGGAVGAENFLGFFKLSLVYLSLFPVNNPPIF